MSVLSTLSGERIFSIEKTADGGFRFIEECDHYFYHDLTIDDVLRLADELVALVEKASIDIDAIADGK